MGNALHLYTSAAGGSTCILPASALCFCVGLVCGGQNWNRTSDTRIFSAVLYQLSYLALWSAIPKDVQKPEYNTHTSLAQPRGGASINDVEAPSNTSAVSVGYRQGACWQSQRSSVLSPACLQ